MADVKWVKLTVNMFDDEKIKLIQVMPEGDALLVIWIRLVTLAGKCNAGGYVYMSESIPYTEEMLSTIFNKPINIIRLAINTFEKLEMIDIDTRGLYLINFEKHQNIDGLEKIKEQNRLRAERHREKQKQLENNVTLTLHNVTVTQQNKIKKENKIRKEKEYITYGVYGWIQLTHEQYQKAVEEYGQDKIDKQIELLDEYIQSNNNKNKYKDWNLVLRKSIREGWFKQSIEKQQAKANEFDWKAYADEKIKEEKGYDYRTT